MFSIGITDHVEGALRRPSGQVYQEVAELVAAADELGVRYAWFSEHHTHAHQGHLPAPLLYAMHLCARTRQIHLGTAIICLNLHHPLDVAEQIAVADILCDQRLAPGFGSGSTPEEFALFGLADTPEAQRHEGFERSLRTIMGAWSRVGATDALSRPPSLPIPAADLPSRCWAAVNSVGAARIAGRLNLNMLFSHLRTPAQYREYRECYRAAGGTRLVAANRPVFVGMDDASALAEAEPALRTVWRRFRQEGKIPAATPEPADPADLCAHPINFLVGGRASVMRQLHQLHAQCPFDVANLEFRWAGLSHPQVLQSLRRFMTPDAGAA